jgi:glyoxylase-like metal-dependent hydrolase (beta-lactamase superfamily II)
VNLQIEQSRLADPPYDTLRAEERIAFDLSSDRVAVEYRAWWPDFVRHVEQAAGPTGGVVRDFNGGSARWSDGLTPARLSPLRRRLPHLVLQDAIGEPADVRHLGTDRVGDRLAHVVSYADPSGELASLYVDTETALPLSVDRLVDHVRYGDAVERTAWENWEVRDGLFLPARTRVTVAGRPLAEMIVDSVASSGPSLERAFAALDSALAARAGPAPHTGGNRDPASDDGATLEPVEEGVWTATSPAAPGYRMLVVDLGEGLLVAEAPAPEHAVAAVLREAERQVGKPVIHGVITHHHSDHAGGLGAFVRAGIRVWTTQGNVDFVRDVATAPRRVTGAVPADAPPLVETVVGEHRFQGDTPVVLRDVGPHPHVAEHLVVLVPSAGVVFQGDLVRFPPEGGIEPARPQTRALDRLIQTLDWPVTSIVGVHGRAGTVADLRRAMEAAGRGS